MNRFQKFVYGYLCVALALALGVGSACGIGIWKSVVDIAQAPHPDWYGNADGAYIAEQILQGQRSLFLTCGEAISAPDPDDLTVEFSVTAVPFAIAAGGSATAFVRGSSIPLQLRDGVLEGSARVPLADLAYSDDGPLAYRILLNDGGTQRNQIVTPEFYFHESPFVGSIDQSWASPYDGTLNLSFHYELDSAYVPFGDAPAKANIYALTYTYGGEGERAQDLMFNAYFEDGALELEEAFEVGENSLLRFYAEVVGESGMVYRYWLQDFVSPEYEDIFAFPWWEEDLDSREYIYVAGTDEQVQFWF